MKLRWYRTPCNIYMEKDFQHLITTIIFKIPTFITFAPNMHLWNSTKEIKGKTHSRFEPMSHLLLAYPLTNWAMQKINFQILFYKWKLLIKALFIFISKSYNGSNHSCTVMNVPNLFLAMVIIFLRCVQISI